MDRFERVLKAPLPAPYPAMRTISARADGSLRSPTSWVSDMAAYLLWATTAAAVATFGVVTVLTAGIGVIFFPAVAVIAVGAVLACRGRPHSFWGVLLFPAFAVPAAAFVLWRGSRNRECSVEASCVVGHRCTQTTVCTHDPPPPGNVSVYLAICIGLALVSIALFVIAGRRSKRRQRARQRAAG
ncbi:hypothetical protein [Allobranchiibius sp. GilTou73]|uniref:hypothetical protein n=1 Tax=Allobranchiibius sp. GilTou73 TaxID=2904523 RepID=UPI001F44FF58|nr:hypothetical protein [Allobranchiibius sp. GilTou73]UIJ34578.1 hypothetical protein LVQ62_15975 [Allobranchiibius sp. GilTou73]